MIDFELTDREKEILAEELSKSSQNANDGFFSSRDEIQNNLETYYSEEISSERIDEICNEIIDDIYDFGEAKYSNAKSHLEQYGVLMEEPNPVDLGLANNKTGQEQNRDKTSNYERNQSSAPSDSSSYEDNSGKSKGKEDYFSDENKEARAIKKEIEERAYESQAKSAQLKNEAEEIRRSIAQKSFMNPYALMGYTFAKMSIMLGDFAKNVMTLNVGIKGLIGKNFSLSGKKIPFTDTRLPFNMASTKHKRNWGNEPTAHENGEALIEKIKKTDLFLENGRYEKAEEEYSEAFKDMASNKKLKLDPKEKRVMRELLDSINERLKQDKGDDSEAAKKAKENMRNLNKKIMEMVKKLFGIFMKSKNQAPEIASGPGAS